MISVNVKVETKIHKFLFIRWWRGTYDEGQDKKEFFFERHFQVVIKFAVCSLRGTIPKLHNLAWGI